MANLKNNIGDFHAIQSFIGCNQSALKKVLVICLYYELPK